jgi:ATP-dependent RNA helicase RhlE
VAEKVKAAGWSATDLQGNLSQNRRKAAMDGFRSGKVHVLIATDIAARGIDVSQITHVINYDIPDTPEAYTHRIGRTGRAAKTGDAYTLVVQADDAMVRVIERKLGRPIERKVLENFDYKAQPANQTTHLKPGHPNNTPRPHDGGQARPAGSGHPQGQHRPGVGNSGKSRPYWRQRRRPR